MLQRTTMRLALVLAFGFRTAQAQNAAAPLVPVRISPGAAGRLLATDVPPVYPQKAKQAHIQGAVLLRVVVDATGHVTQVTPLSGPEELRAAAVKSVSQWTYRPYTSRGAAAPFESTVRMEFTFEPPPGSVKAPRPVAPGTPVPAPEQRPLAPPPVNAPVHLSAEQAATLVLTRPGPVYPPSAQAQHVSGTVELHVVINPQGRVANLQAISGPQPLRVAASEAVSRWTFRPYLQNGAPVPVDTTITVKFPAQDPPGK